jgi:hypothetical protein
MMAVNQQEWEANKTPTPYMPLTLLLKNLHVMLKPDYANKIIHDVM